MKILDRYIFRSFLTTLLLWFLSFVGIYVVFDLLSNIDNYLSAGGKRSVVSILSEFYFYRTFLFVDIILSLLILISALTVASTMIRRNEIIALMSLGVPHRRVVTPILLAACLLTSAAFWVREFYLPEHIVQLVKTPHELGEENPALPIRRATDALTRITFDGKAVLPSENRIEEPKFTLPVLLAPFGNELAAQSAQWFPKSENFPEGYLLKGVTKPVEILTSPSLDIDGANRGRSPSPDAERDITSVETPNAPVAETPDASVPSVSPGQDNPRQKTSRSALADKIAGSTIIYSPFDTKTLGPDECFVASGITPEFLAVGESWRMYASTAELIAAAKNASIPLNGKDLQARVHSRIVRPLADLLPLLIGLPFLFLRNDQSPFVGMALGIVFAGLYMGISYSAVFIGTKFDQPILAAWAPILIFTPVVVNVFADLFEIKKAPPIPGKPKTK